MSKRGIKTGPQRPQATYPRVRVPVVAAFLTHEGAIMDDGRVDTDRLMDHLQWTDRSDAGIDVLKRRWAQLRYRMGQQGIDVPALSVVQPTVTEAGTLMRQAVGKAQQNMLDRVLNTITREQGGIGII